MNWQSAAVISLSILFSSCVAFEKYEAEALLLDFSEYIKNHDIEVKGDNGWLLTLTHQKSREESVNDFNGNTDNTSSDAALPAEIDSPGIVERKEASFNIFPIVLLNINYNNELVYISINAISKLPVAISCEIRTGNRADLCTCSYDEMGQPYKYNVQISESSRTWETINYANKGSGEFYFGTQHVIGEVNQDRAREIASLGMDLCAEIIAGTSITDDCVLRINRAMNLRDIYTSVLKEFNKREQQDTSLKNTELLYTYTGKLNSPEYNTEAMLEFSDGVPGTRYSSEQLEIKNLLEQFISFPNQQECLPLKWTLTIPFRINGGLIVE